MGIVKNVVQRFNELSDVGGVVYPLKWDPKLRMRKRPLQPRPNPQ